MSVTKQFQKTSQKIVATEKEVNSEEVCDAATVAQVIMDKEFIEGNKDERFWVSSENAVDSEGEPLKGDKWYRLNKHGKLEKVSEMKAAVFLNWRNKLYVNGNVLQVIERKESLIFRISYSDLLGWKMLEISGIYGRGDIARVAQVAKQEQEADAAGSENMLRGRQLL